MIFNPFVAATSKHYIQLREEISTGRNSVFSVGSEGLWLRQGDTNGQTVIRAARSNADGTILYDVTLISLAENGKPIRRIETKRPTWHGRMDFGCVQDLANFTKSPRNAILQSAKL